MAKKKSCNKKNTKPFSPEHYIRTRARLLPIDKCYKSYDLIDDGLLNIIVTRKHPLGTVTVGIYILDKWCLGVKDSSWHFNLNEEELNQIHIFYKERFDVFEEIDYVEAHNWIYGAEAFAAEAGIIPCKEFELTRYLLEEDDDKTELIEYEFGQDGEYCFVVDSYLEATKYIPLLDKNLGKGNYIVETTHDEDDDDNNRDEVCSWFSSTPDMEYTYKGGNYPKEYEYNYPEIEYILLKETEDISNDEIDLIMSFMPDKLREDLQNVILFEIGEQWGKSKEELENDITFNCYIIGNSLMFLASVGTAEDTLPVILEVMRQSQTFLDFNFGDFPELLLWPAVYILTKDNPRLLKPYLLEPGLNTYFKMFLIERLSTVSGEKSQYQHELITMTAELLEEYKIDLPNRTICDGAVTAFAIMLLVDNGAKEYLPLIEELYATGLVDEQIVGDIEHIRKIIRYPDYKYDVPKTNPYSIRDQYRHVISQLSDNSN